MGALETGKSIAEQILAKLPEGLRGAVKGAFDAPEATDALTLLGDSALARTDYSRQMDDIKKRSEELDGLKTTINADYQRMNDWWNANEPKVKEYDALKAENERLKGNPPPKGNEAPPPSGVSKDDVTAMLAARDAGYAAVLGVATTLAVRHMKDFNEPLDVNALVEYSFKNKVALFDPKADTDAYRALHGEKLTAKAKADEDARIGKLVEERLSEERKTQQQPYPVGGPEPSALDLLNNPERTTRYTADSAAARYNDLVAASSGR